ncbi:hypothetical protein PSN45_002969 [Yamadazyma tenuis]|uniref:uncharacterized protein n=1 Tax=Candida tenuis TaxID=2315449 RepID=UPI0027994F7F|nr:hypothetical protein PSN45_002969 [Yamadazyma tenuis]
MSASVVSGQEKDKHQVVYATQEDVGSLKENESDAGEYFDHFRHERTLSKSLTSRHLGMITLVGVFGTGLFLSSGGTLATTGPVGMLLAYILVGLVVGASQMCITECACFMPVTSGYVRHSEHFVDDALGFMMGWTDIYSSIMPSELSAAAVVVQYWTDLSPAIFITIFGVACIATNVYNVRWYGEIEFVFGILKLSLIVILIVTGLVIDLGGTGDRIGFRYWKDPGPFNAKYTTGSLGNFAAFWKTVSSVVYAYGGVQAIGLLSGEAEFPRRAIYRAAKRVFYRVFTLYLLTVFVLTLIVPSNNETIASPNGTAAASPFVVAMQGQVKVLPHYINAIVCTSAFSAANIGIIKASRTLFALAAKGQAPKLFLKVNKHGLPWVGVTFACAFIPLAYMSVSSGSKTVFSWFQSITSSNLLLNWILISVNHIGMTRAFKAQGYSRKLLPYKFKGTVFASWFSLFFSVLFLLTGGFTNFIHGQFDFGSFFGAYFIIPLSIILYFGYKLIKKTKLKDPKKVDLKSIFRDIELYPEPEYPKLKGWEYITLLWA